MPKLKYPLQAYQRSYLMLYCCFCCCCCCCYCCLYWQRNQTQFIWGNKWWMTSVVWPLCVSLALMQLFRWPSLFCCYLYLYLPAASVACNMRAQSNCALEAKRRQSVIKFMTSDALSVHVATAFSSSSSCNCIDSTKKQQKIHQIFRNF